MRRSQRLHAVPAGVLVAVAVVDLVLNRRHTVLSLAVVAPLVAGTIVRRRATAIYAVLALLVAGLLGLYDEQYTGGAVDAQVVRLCGVAIGGVLAVFAATVRLHRDQQLARATQAAAAAQDAVALAARLQRSLLTDPPSVPGLDLAARYLPAVRRAHVGGDWYDAFPLVCGATMLVIGDVAGHDVAAAATMAQARGVLRGIAQTVEGGPAAVLTALDRTLLRLGNATLITLVVAVVRRDGGETVLQWSNAGHPAPVRISADGAVDVLERAPDLLLGAWADTSRRDHEVRLRPGDTLLLYTDGLVERRGVALDEGTAWLAGELSTLARSPLAQLCDRLLTRVDEHVGDDVALLAARLTG